MGRSETEFLTELGAKRAKLVEGLHENDAYEGFLSLLTQLYPDEAHFIYELLQNAEDARARKVRFTLTQDELCFEHDGPRLFSEADVEAITNVGRSLKRDDLTQIGKFGVGFKAVFAYTDSPIVRSGAFHFQISHLFCPTAIDDGSGPLDGTLFRFVLRGDLKSRDVAHAEILQGLASLTSETLLFLDWIEEIRWEGDGLSGCLRRSHPGSDSAVVVVEGPSEGDVLRWLRLDRELDDFGGQRVSVAFALESNGSNAQDDPSAASVQPVDGRLFVFFPLVKEITKLRFHVNGPFSSTVARDSIPTALPENQQLIKACAELIAASLDEIRERGLLTASFLDVLPSSTDELGEFYAPIHGAIVDAMETRPLVPTSSKGHAPGVTLLAGAGPIREVFTPDLLPFITGRTGAQLQWAVGMPEGGRGAAVLSDVGVAPFGWSELDEAVSVRLGDGSDDESAAWLASRSHSWMQRFYALLCDVVARVSYPECTIAEIIRLEDGSHRRSSQWRGLVHFPPTSGISVPLETFRVVARAVLDAGSQVTREKAVRFLKAAGVKEIGTEEEIRALVRSCYGGGELSHGLSEHLSHLKRFVAFWSETGKVSAFAGGRLFLDRSGGWLRSASEICVDEPYVNTGLAQVFELLDPDEPKRLALWEGYEEEVPGVQDFAMALGAIRIFPIEEQEVTQTHRDWRELAQDWRRRGVRRTHTGRSSDFFIARLADVAALQDVGASLVLWRSLSRAPQKVLEAVFRPNRQYPLRRAPSSLVYALREVAWVPDRDGVFHRPLDVSSESLHATFRIAKRDERWLEAVGFGANAVRAKAEKRQRREAAELLGIPEEGLSLLNGIGSLPDAARSAFLREAEGLMADYFDPAFPERTPRNRDRRASKVGQRAAEAEQRRYESRSRRVRASGTQAKEQARVYLRDLYSEDGVMYCQVCEGEMPFKLRNGLYYFEAVMALDLDSEHRENHLALCPVCAAKFRYAREGGDGPLLEAIDRGDLEVGILLADTDDSVRFVEVHMADLAAVLDVVRGPEWRSPEDDEAID